MHRPRVTVPPPGNYGTMTRSGARPQPGTIDMVKSATRAAMRQPVPVGNPIQLAKRRESVDARA